MATKTKQWATGGGNATIQYNGQGDGDITITSDANSLFEARSMQITVETTDGSGIQRIITVNQAAKQRIDLSAAVVTASNQTYSGSALTPTPTVTLNGSTVPSTGYDVSYSNNTNAGTATITITGKGEYIGAASGTFTIAKASRTLSFADNYMVLNTSSTGTKTATPSAGSGDGVLTYSIANTTYATINSSTGAVTAKTSDGSVIVTATIAEGTNYLSASASYTLYVFATTHNYSYSGSAKNVTLPPGTYQFQCWGAQGASCSDGYSGGKGGYSVGQMTIANALAIQVLVGGQNGYNGGGSSTGSSSYNSGDTYGRSSMGNGGGATDIRLSDGALLSRMIVAGGGSGGANGYKEEWINGYLSIGSSWTEGSLYAYSTYRYVTDGGMTDGVTYKFVCDKTPHHIARYRISTDSYVDDVPYNTPFVHVSGYYYIIYYNLSDISPTPTMNIYYLSITYFDDYYSNHSWVGGGTTSGGHSGYYAQQNAAGNGGSFGQGANQTATNYRYCSGAGGGGWYGGGADYDDNSMRTIEYSGGGSGWVNVAASAGNRPSGYTGLQLDSGTTYAGSTSFPAPGGGNETGHSGNGYARITRLS